VIRSLARIKDRIDRERRMKKKDDIFGFHVHDKKDCRSVSFGVIGVHNPAEKRPSWCHSKNVIERIFFVDDGIDH